MNKVQLVKETFKEKRNASGQIIRYRADGFCSSNVEFTVFVEGNKIIFANLGKQLELCEKVIEEIIPGKQLVISSRDEDGPIQIFINLN